jgi:hypothetical protein
MKADPDNLLYKVSVNVYKAPHSIAREKERAYPSAARAPHHAYSSARPRAPEFEQSRSVECAVRRVPSGLSIRPRPEGHANGPLHTRHRSESSFIGVSPLCSVPRLGHLLYMTCTCSGLDLLSRAEVALAHEPEFCSELSAPLLSRQILGAISDCELLTHPDVSSSLHHEPACRI